MVDVETMTDDYSWDLDPTDKMRIVIKHRGLRVMSLFLGEAMKSAGRKNIMDHVRECDRSPWLHNWTKDAMDEEMKILQGKA